MKTDPNDSAAAARPWRVSPNDTAYPAQDDDTWHLGMTVRVLLALEFAKVRLAANLDKSLQSARMNAAVSDADALIAALNEEKV